MKRGVFGFILALSFQNILTMAPMYTAKDEPIASGQDNKLNVLLPETRKPYADPHAIKPNLDEPTAPTNVHTNSEYLQGQKLTDTNPNQNMANQIKRERPISPSKTGKKI